jgi:thymidylate synthase
MVEYLNLLDHILSKGVPRYGEKEERTLTIFGAQVKYDLSEGFPLVTTRDLTWSWLNIITREVPWMLSGSTSAKVLSDVYGCTLWNRWAEDSQKKLGTPEGELGKVYGKQLRHWGPDETDQLTDVINTLKTTPGSRRGIVSLWNHDEVQKAGVKQVNVANCVRSLHLAIMPYETAKGIYEPRLDMVLDQRSADVPAGVPHDLGDWTLVQMLIAIELGVPVGTLTHNLGDAQIYDRQIEKVKEQLTRRPLPRPEVNIQNAQSGDIYNHKPEDFILLNYQHHDKIFMPTAL